MCHSSAREKREEARKLIADGIDLNARRRALREAPADTFKAVAAEWLALQTKALASDTMAMLGARLKSFLYPYIGKRPVARLPPKSCSRRCDAATHRGTRPPRNRASRSGPCGAGASVRGGDGASPA
jgi:hypothetical protein